MFIIVDKSTIKSDNDENPISQASVENSINESPEKSVSPSKNFENYKDKDVTEEVQPEHLVKKTSELTVIDKDNKTLSKEVTENNLEEIQEKVQLSEDSENNKNGGDI